MSCRYCSSNPEVLGANPLKVQWRIVRGDDARFRVEFYEEDEVNLKDISTWTFASSAKNTITKEIFALTIEVFDGYVELVVTPADTEDWGVEHSSVLAELDFDLEVTMPNEDDELIVWTPIIGTISVVRDVTRGGQ